MGKKTVLEILYDESMTLYSFLGMLHTGIGESQLNAFLKTITLPGISDTSLKYLERVVGQAIEKVAKESSEKWLREEKR